MSTSLCQALVHSLDGFSNSRDAEGRTLLMVHASGGNIELVKLLVRHQSALLKINLLDIKDNTKGWTALMFAAEKGHASVCEILAQRNASLDVVDGRYRSTALMFAAFKGHTETCEILIQHNASLDLQRKGGYTALMYAAQNWHIPIVDSLVLHKASLDIQDEQGDSALMFAACQGHTPIVDSLVQHNASLNLQDEDGYTALILAAYHGHLDAARVLLIAGADIDLKTTEENKDALQWAWEENHPTIVTLIMKERSWRRRKSFVMFWSAYKKSRPLRRCSSPAVDKALAIDVIARHIAEYVC
jgi:ankyrin repeat protein